MVMKMSNLVNETTESLNLLKNEIKNIILNNKLETNFNLSEENKKLLDEFFERTYQDVILKTLLKAKERLLICNDYTNRKKDHFTILSLMAIFSKQNNKIAINYLVNKYRNKIIKLGLDELGIIDCSYIKCTRTMEPSYLKFEYFDQSEFSKIGYSYTIEFTFSMTKEKKLRLINQK